MTTSNLLTYSGIGLAVWWLFRRKDKLAESLTQVNTGSPVVNASNFIDDIVSPIIDSLVPPVIPVIMNKVFPANTPPEMIPAQPKTTAACPVKYYTAQPVSQMILPKVALHWCDGTVKSS
jgi:hypothetical protein